MKCARLFAVVVGFAVLADLGPDAFARYRMYNPATGTFMQRDPLGTPLEPPLARNVSDSQFTQRDPTKQYADGMNLYEYVRSKPSDMVDPLGLYGIEVHFVDTLGACWRTEPELCFKACVAIADATWAWDDPGKDAPTNAALCNLGVGLLLGCDKNYDVHMPGAGAPTLGGKQNPVVAGSANNSAVRGNIDKALENCDVKDIGKALHSLQDSYAHAGTPGWFGSHPSSEKDVDNPASDPEKYQKMKGDLQSVMNEIAERCWCELCGPGSPLKD
jgi:uncharacterized protein RhaS with RHS repeats